MKSMLRGGKLLPAIQNGVKPAFMCCDLQEKFSDKIPGFQNGVFVANRFARASEVFECGQHYITTEQYPKGLGATVKDIQLPTNAPKPFAKTKFSMITDDVAPLLQDRNMVVLFGIESHVCVLQTVADLVDQGKFVVIPADGVFSQKATDRKYALKLFQNWNSEQVLLSTSESILLQLVGDASSKTMKPIQNLLKVQPPEVWKK